MQLTDFKGLTHTTMPQTCRNDFLFTSLLFRRCTVTLHAYPLQRTYFTQQNQSDKFVVMDSIH